MDEWNYNTTMEFRNLGIIDVCYNYCMKNNFVEQKENGLSITGKVRVIKTNSLTGEVISIPCTLR